MFRRIIKYSNKHFGLFKKLASITDKRIKAQIDTIKIGAAIICMQLSNLGSLNSLSPVLVSGKYPSVSTIARTADSMDYRQNKGCICRYLQNSKKIKDGIGVLRNVDRSS